MARDLIASPAARRAFDLRSESESLRARYGYTTLGQCSLLARRLVEAGTRFIGVDHAGWDTHFNCFPSLERDLIPQADQAFSALVTDLHDRGLLDSTLVVMMGEMGRTPRVNDKGGRDHWTFCYSVLLAGAGIKGGTLCGTSDAHAAYIKDRPVHIRDIVATIYHCLGIDPDTPVHDHAGRPIPVAHGGRPVAEILA
jgi:uncharacterized protein (DUF1501 family)